LVLGSAGLALGVGIGFGAAAVVRDRAARSLRADFGDDGPSDDERAAYTTAVDERDTFRLVSGVAGTAALTSFVAAGLLLALEEASAPASQAGDFVVLPFVASTEGGAVLLVRF
jgi:hypothetical protein